jgi:hypothetical protein
MTKHQVTLGDQTTEFLLYTAPNGAIKVEVLISHESIWLTQKRMAGLTQIPKTKYCNRTYAKQHFCFAL